MHPGAPIDNCITRDDLMLLYVDISPKNAHSRQNLRKRVAYHYRGDAEGSTLKLPLGVLFTPVSCSPV